MLVRVNTQNRFLQTRSPTSEEVVGFQKGQMWDRLQFLTFLIDLILKHQHLMNSPWGGSKCYFLAPPAYSSDIPADSRHQEAIGSPYISLFIIILLLIGGFSQTCEVKPRLRQEAARIPTHVQGVPPLLAQRGVSQRRFSLLCSWPAAPWHSLNPS